MSQMIQNCASFGVFLCLGAYFLGVQLNKRFKSPLTNPLLLAAGSEEHLEDLFAQLRACNPMETETVILPGCNHGNGMYKQTEMFQRAIRNFVFRHFEETEKAPCSNGF